MWWSSPTTPSDDRVREMLLGSREVVGDDHLRDAQAPMAKVYGNGTAEKIPRLQ